jgi:hypothetical protein
MSKRPAGRIVGRGALLGGLAIVLATTLSLAQERQGLAGNAVQQGIQVHGHWVMEVRNPDGTLATRREFENAFVGGAILPAILNPNVAALGKPVGWSVTLVGGMVIAGGPSECEAGALSRNLIVTNSGPPNPALTLSGSAVSLGSLTVTAVRSSILNLYGNCSSQLFTATTLQSPVSLEAGQTVSVTVTISFQ